MIHTDNLKYHRANINLKMETHDGEYFVCYAEVPNGGKWVRLAPWLVDNHISWKGPHLRAMEAYKHRSIYDPIF